MRLIGWMLVIVALVLTTWLAIILIRGKADTSRVAWSEAVCARGSAAVALNQEISGNGLVTQFSDQSGDCNQISKIQARTARAALQKSFQSLRRIGLPEPSRGRYVQLVRNLPQDGMRQIDDIQFNPYPQGIATLDINLSAGIDNITLTYGQAQLVLADLAPGLSNQARQRLAAAFTELTINGPIASIDGDGLDQSGAYELWLMRRFGSAFILDALKACREDCSWPNERDLALSRRGANPKLLKENWLQKQDDRQRQAEFIDSR